MLVSATSGLQLPVFSTDGPITLLKTTGTPLLNASALQWQRMAISATSKGMMVTLDGDNTQPLKRSVSAGSGVPVSTGLYMSPGSPSGSDVSNSSLPGPSSSYNYNIYRPVARTGVVMPPVETTSSCDNNNDPPTSLSLSLPGADSSEVSDQVAEQAQLPKSNTVTPLLTGRNAPAQESSPEVGGRPGCGSAGFSTELMTVMKEMIRNEVRNYMIEQSGGGGMCYQGMSGEGFRSVAVNNSAGLVKLSGEKWKR
ncbi:hypothetical protein OIU78_028701 [Salix suchowensis]|nr:hypothetical protein OIU78_028701 [Salix suchowensis]